MAAMRATISQSQPEFGPVPWVSSCVILGCCSLHASQAAYQTDPPRKNNKVHNIFFILFNFIHNGFYLFSCHGLCAVSPTASFVVDECCDLFRRQLCIGSDGRHGGIFSARMLTCANDRCKNFYLLCY